MVDAAKIDLRRDALTQTELIKHLKNLYTRLNKQNWWSDNETARTSQASLQGQERFKERCTGEIAARALIVVTEICPMDDNEGSLLCLWMHKISHNN